MKKGFVFAFAVVALLAGCASSAKKEFDRYAAETKPQAGITVKWSEYFEGLYMRAQAANAPANVLAGLNDGIYLSKQYEKGEIDQDTFVHRRRAIGAAAQEAEELRTAQKWERIREGLAQQAAASQAQVAQLNARQSTSILNDDTTSGNSAMMGFLKSNSTSGTLRYCRYSNGVVNTINFTDLCPLSIQ